MQFTKAQRKRAKLRLALSGPAGSGKTYSALLLAQGLGGKIAVIDTERGSASLYSDLVEFDTLELNPPYAPERFIDAINAAATAGYEVCILDSITMEWSGSGGCLEINEQLAQARYRGNTWSAWNETTPRHRDFLDAIMQAPMHVIATMRSKTETVQGEDKKVKKIGMKSEQREGAEYEFSVVFDLEHSNHYAIATKDRTRLFLGDPFVITPDTGKKLAAWLDAGNVPPVERSATVITGSSAPDGEGVPNVDIAEAFVTRMCEYVAEDRAPDVIDLWNATKADHATAAYAWRLLKKEKPQAFKYVDAAIKTAREVA
jgi:hypothetical protein